MLYQLRNNRNGETYDIYGVMQKSSHNVLFLIRSNGAWKWVKGESYEPIGQEPKGKQLIKDYEGLIGLFGVGTKEDLQKGIEMFKKMGQKDEPLKTIKDTAGLMGFLAIDLTDDQYKAIDAGQCNYSDAQHALIEKCFSGMGFSSEVIETGIYITGAGLEIDEDYPFDREKFHDDLKEIQEAVKAHGEREKGMDELLDELDTDDEENQSEDPGEALCDIDALMGFFGLKITDKEERDRQEGICPDDIKRDMVEKFLEETYGVSVSIAGGSICLSILEDKHLDMKQAEFPVWSTELLQTLNRLSEKKHRIMNTQPGPGRD